MRIRRRRALMWAIAIVWIVVGPLSVAFGACAAMGAMCEGPCGVGPCAVDLGVGDVTLIAGPARPANLVAQLRLPHLVVPDPPPRLFPSI